MHEHDKKGEALTVETAAVGVDRELAAYTEYPPGDPRYRLRPGDATWRRRGGDAASKLAGPGEAGLR